MALTPWIIRLSILSALLLSAACSPPSEAPEVPVELQAEGEDPVQPYLDEVKALDDEELTTLFAKLADEVGASGNEFAFDERDETHLVLQATFLELEYRALKLPIDLGVPYEIVKLEFLTYACAPWLRPVQLRIPPRTLDYILGTAAEDEARDVAVATDDSVTIVGWTEGSLLSRNAGGRDAFVCRYGANGKIRWGRQFGGVGDDSAFGVALDEAGNVYVVGQTDDRLGSVAAFGADGFARKLDGAGNVVWTGFIGSGSKADTAYRVAVDGDLVHVVGATQSNLNGSRQGFIDGYLRSFDLSGNLLNTEQFAYANETYAKDVATDSSGDIYVVGYLFSGEYVGEKFDPVITAHDGFVTRFARSGGSLWTRTIDSFASDEASGVSVDQHDDVYVVGQTTGTLGQQHHGQHDAFARKYDAAGTELWTHQFGTRAFDVARDVGIDAHGDVTIVGTTRGVLGGASQGGRDGFLVKLDPSGATIHWTEQFGDGGDDEAHALALDSRSISTTVGGSWQQGLFGASGAAYAILHDDSGASVPW